MAGVEVVVLATQRQQLVVCAALDDTPLLEHDDAVGVAHGAQAVGDDKGGAPAHERVHASLHQPLGVGVDARRGLVEDEHRRVGDGCTRDGQQLPLALTQVAAVAGEYGVVAIGQTAYEAVGTHQLCGLDAVLVGGPEVAVTDVV